MTHKTSCELGKTPLRRLTPEDVARLRLRARAMRELILNTATNAGRGHIAPAFSLAEVLAALYFSILRVNPREPNWKDRDRCILSKGHGCLVLYAVLAEAGFFPVEALETFCCNGSMLGGHPDRLKVPGVDLSCGSLGHGLSLGVGIALAAQFDHKDFHTVVVLGDGELDEGSVWEAVLAGAQHRLDNLVAVVDRNRLQMTGETEKIMGLDPLADKWRAFRWSVREVDGHCFEQLIPALQAAFDEADGRPKVIIANTVKGKGVSFMENQAAWHFKIPDATQRDIALAEIRGG